MNSIFVHITPSKLPFCSDFNLDKYTFNKIPDYARISFDQCEKFLNTKPIIIDDEYINEYMIEEIMYLYNICKEKFPIQKSDAFWFVTMFRLFVVYDYCKRFKIQNFIHLEYDNLIYSDLKCLQTLNPSIYFTRVGPYYSSAGFIYCNSITNFEKFVIGLKQILFKGDEFIEKCTKTKIISEMKMIDIIYNYTKNIIDYLPILPEGIGNDNFDKLNVLFDGASYGQYIGGTNNGHDSGWAGSHHYVGNMILNKKIEIKFENHKPYVIFNKEKIDILNLHIHSKKLNNYV